jgi:hypothetical protein
LDVLSKLPQIRRINSDIDSGPAETRNETKPVFFGAFIVFLNLAGYEKIHRCTATITSFSESGEMLAKIQIGAGTYDTFG